MHRLSLFAHELYNSMQLEKLWAFAQQRNIDRERVVMTNMTQAIEFCLKAVKTHAEYRENRTFTFDAGHNLRGIYESLPQQLKVEIEKESRIFAKEYSKFRTDVENDVQQLQEHSWNNPFNKLTRSDWTRIALRIREKHLHSSFEL